MNKNPQNKFAKSLQPLKSTKNFSTNQFAMNKTYNDRSMNKTMMPRNVNIYRHLLKTCYTTEKDINWILDLRGQNDEMKEKLKRIPESTFSFYDKKLECQQAKKTSVDFNIPRIKKNDVYHLYNHYLGPTKDQNVVQFATTLRSESFQSKEMLDKERGFKVYPCKDRNEYPSFLPKFTKDQLKKSDKIRKVSAFDGRLSYPKYQFKLKNPNTNQYIHMLKGSQGLENGAVNWQISLRGNYKPIYMKKNYSKAELAQQIKTQI